MRKTGIDIQQQRPLHLFDGYGVELEYMIVNMETLDVMPVADRLLQLDEGEIVSELSDGSIAWSNELALHLIELKTNGPVKSYNGVASAFQDEVREINRLLEKYRARLMPTAMHPWMDPLAEMKIWPHEYNAIYKAYDRIFDCRGHGWANLQSTHLNLPFHGDDEFAALHAAIRLVLPLVPALAASSPIADGELKSHLDFRMETYRTNALKVPSVNGFIVPEPVFTEKEYREDVLEPMYKDIRPYDPEGVLQHEWLNGRGAMARFDRGAIELRVMDIQETPFADLAILELITSVIKTLCSGHWSDLNQHKSLPVGILYPIFMDSVKTGDMALIKNTDYLRVFNYPECSATAGELWRWLFEETDRVGGGGPGDVGNVGGPDAADPDMDVAAGDGSGAADPGMGVSTGDGSGAGMGMGVSTESGTSLAAREILTHILDHGPLAKRILKSLPEKFSKADLDTTWRKLCNCLQDGELFLP